MNLMFSVGGWVGAVVTHAKASLIWFCGLLILVQVYGQTKQNLRNE